MFRLADRRFLKDPWVVANAVTGGLASVAVCVAWGPVALVYLFASFAFGIGLHPLGARWIQEHFVVHEGQETYSYYGFLNWVTFNVGYHNEHHDLPTVPWNKLPALRHLAPEFYEPLYAHSSWTMLLLRFLTDAKLTLYSRVSRAG